jgi:hypothetical protein
MVRRWRVIRFGTPEMVVTLADIVLRRLGIPKVPRIPTTPLWEQWRRKSPLRSWLERRAAPC